MGKKRQPGALVLALLPAIGAVALDAGVTEKQAGLLHARSNAIPGGVRCDVERWCDDVTCTDVCARGTVEVDEWIRNAHRLQHRLASELPMCYSSFFGTHNSAITLASGYGNQDPIFSGLLDYVEWIVPEGTSQTIRTNDQYFSLTDQLNMGVRMVELDTHYVLGSLRIAHCGGLHLDGLNKLVEALNYIAHSLGYDVRWDTETVGCNPSLSSIPAAAQRLFIDALAEIRAWMDDVGNEREFLIVYLDDEPDLLEWGVVPKLVDEIRQVFPDDEVFKPTDRATQGGIPWPPVRGLLEQGFRVMFVSSSDYGVEMGSHVFARGPDVCNWQEPGLRDIDTPSCTVHGTSGFMVGTMLRTPSCEIQYGPLNCDFAVSKKNSPILDEATMREVMTCGLNVPAPDLLTPERAAAAVWTWAPGYPQPSTDCDDLVYVAASDGRWRTSGGGASCEDLAGLPSACMRVESALARPEWVLADCPLSCPEGTVFANPRHPLENAALVNKLMEEGSSFGVRIPSAN